VANAKYSINMAKTEWKPGHFGRPSESTVVENVTFRGTSRWLGVAKAAGTDTVAGFAASGDAFIAQYAPSPA
jgi:hypothetical protein